MPDIRVALLTAREPNGFLRGTDLGVGIFRRQRSIARHARVRDSVAARFLGTAETVENAEDDRRVRQLSAHRVPVLR